jgi:protein-S-isoprenylcysteine O-methyltransferase Ste14
MIGRLILQTFIWFGAMGLLLFLPAGTLHWPGAWVFLVEMVVLGLVTGLWLARHDPALLKERLAAPLQKDQPPADKVVVSLILVAACGWLVVMALDAARFAWSSVPAYARAIGALSLLVATWIGYRAMRVNSFAAPVVKIQKNRGQTVVTTGPYSYVRHPLYAGALFFFAGTPLLLGSWLGLALAPVLALLLGLRIRIEERALRTALPGYDDYAARVRYRLIPLIW